jgi:hypothetical protein
MSKYPTYIEITGNIQVHHPVKAKGWVQTVFISDDELADIIDMRPYMAKLRATMDGELAA